MPDIKTALERVLDDWEAEDGSLSTNKLTQPTQPPQEKQTMHTSVNTPVRTPVNIPAYAPQDSVSERTFNFVKANPYINNKDAVETLVTQGLKENTVSSLIYQMIRAGMVSRDKDYRLTALQKRYTPLQIVRSQLKTHSGRRAPAAGIAALNTPPKTLHNAPVAQPTLCSSATAPLTAQLVLETLSVKEARALYLELHKMFGG